MAQYTFGNDQHSPKKYRTDGSIVRAAANRPNARPARLMVAVGSPCVAVTDGHGAVY